MKRIISIVFLIPVIAFAQKEIKPSVTKAEVALQKGLFDEAKSIIDVTVASQEFMVDKKGQPSKSSSKAWYLRGLIYAAIDTTSVVKFKSLSNDPFAVAKESFEKCNCNAISVPFYSGMTQELALKSFGEPIKKNKTVTGNDVSEQWVYNEENYLYFKNGKLEKFQNSGKPLRKDDPSFVNRILVGQALPMTIDEVSKTLAQKYLDRGYKTYLAKDFKTAFVDIDKVIFFLPNDTTQLMNAGVYFAPAAGEEDKAIEYINKYLIGGGTNTDVYIQLYYTYVKKKDWDSALKSIKVLTSMHPDNIDYLNLEYNVYVQTNNLDGAKALMKKRADGDPNDTESRFFLVLISLKEQKIDEAKHWDLEVLKINPDHFEANEEMVSLLSQEAKVLNDQRNGTNDTKKRLDLRNQRFTKLKEVLPYAEKCANLKPTDENSLYRLQSLYDNLSAYDESYEKKIADLKKKMKALGLEVD